MAGRVLIIAKSGFAAVLLWPIHTERKQHGCDVASNLAQIDYLQVA